MTRSRGDALQLIGMNVKTGAASAIGVPRDSWVDIPGYGSNKINAALYFGGPQALGAAVGNLIGIQPDYVFVTRFKYFQALIGSIGGVDITNPTAFSDSALKPEGFAKGRIHLGPYDAMVFSRIRHNLIRGDFDRSANQQRVIRGIQAKVRARAHEPGFLEQGVLTVMQYLSTDLSPERALQARPGRRPGRPLEGHHLRRPGRHRQHRRRQRRAALHRPGPPPRRPRPERRDPGVLLVGDSVVEVRGAPATRLEATRSRDLVVSRLGRGRPTPQHRGCAGESAPQAKARSPPEAEN